MSRNTKKKMSQEVYIDQIFQPIMKLWIDVDHNFILEKDGNSSHKPEKSNIVYIQKKINSVKFYFNCHLAPDFAQIKNC